MLNTRVTCRETQKETWQQTGLIGLTMLAGNFQLQSPWSPAHTLTSTPVRKRIPIEHARAVVRALDSTESSNSSMCSSDSQSSISNEPVELPESTASTCTLPSNYTLPTWLVPDAPS
jgi:hypothetical protein